MNKKKIIEWTSRVLWVIGALLALTACVCLIVAFAKTEVGDGYAIVNVYKDGVLWTTGERVSADVITKLPVKLYKASGYGAVCSVPCFLASKIARRAIDRR